jgi:hypothetical protein
LWGGKRLTETWDNAGKKLNVVLDGPAGVRESIMLVARDTTINEVLVNGEKQPFFFDASQGLVHGIVTFGAEPLRVEVRCSESGASVLPQKAAESTPLGKLLNAGR